MGLLDSLLAQFATPSPQAQQAPQRPNLLSASPTPDDPTANDPGAQNPALPTYQQFRSTYEPNAWGAAFHNGTGAFLGKLFGGDDAAQQHNQLIQQAQQAEQGRMNVAGFQARQPGYSGYPVAGGPMQAKTPIPGMVGPQAGFGAPQIPGLPPYVSPFPAQGRSDMDPTGSAAPPAGMVTPYQPPLGPNQSDMNPAGMPGYGPASPQSSAPSTPPPPAFGVPNLVQQIRQLSSFPAGLAAASKLTELLPKAPPGSYLAIDGSLQVMPQAPQTLGALKYGEAAGGKAADLQYAEPISAATEWGKVAPELYKLNNSPFDLSRPGAARYVNGQLVAQNPIQVPGVDASGAPTTQFVFPPPMGGPTPAVNGFGIGGAGGGSGLPGSGAVPNPQPSGQANPNVPSAQQGLLAPPPAAAGPGGSTPATAPIVTGLSPLQHESQVGHAKALEEYGAGLDTSASQATQNNFLVDQMRKESQSWGMGKFADIEGDARAYLQAMFPDSPSLNQKVGDFQSFQKNAMELTRQAVRQTSSRAAFQEMQLIQTALPSATMSKGGFSQIADQLQSVNDFQIAKQQAAQSWRPQHGGTLDGFDSAWNQNVTPATFLVHRMGEGDLTSLRDNLNKTPQGRIALQQLTQRVQYAAQNGLFQD